jgi:hypothetical protein
MRKLWLVMFLTGTTLAVAQAPMGVHDAIEGLCSTPATRTSFTLDRDMLATANSYLNGGEGPAGQLNSISIENDRFRGPAFYIPENMHALEETFRAAGWKHLVDQNASPREQASPTRTYTDLWLHFHDLEIDDVMVLIRGPREMSVVEVNGELRPLDLVHLSGHFGIPKVDPNAVMVPAPDGK